MDYQDAVHKMFQGHADALNSLVENAGKLLNKQDENTPAWAGDAFNAAVDLATINNTLTDVHKNMLTQDLARNGYWKGPAADTFKGFATGLENFVYGIKNAIVPVDGRDGYRRAVDLTSQWHDWATRNYTNWADTTIKAHNDIHDGELGQALWNQARVMDKWGWLDWDHKENNNFTFYYNLTNDALQKVYDDYKDGMTDTFQQLGTHYDYAFTKFTPFAIAPTFPKAKADPNDPTANNPYAPKDTDGDGTPDYLDDYKNDPTKVKKDEPLPKIPEPDKLADADGDGTPDYLDPYKNDPTKAFKDQPIPDIPEPTPPPDAGALDGLKPGGLDVPPAGGAPADALTTPPGADGGLDGLKSGGLDVPPFGGAPPPDALTTPAGGAGALDGLKPGGLDVPPAAVPLPLSAVPDLVAPPAGKLATGPNGTGFDVTGDGVPDVGLNGQLLPGGGLPAGSKVVTSPNGTKGVDLNGDGVPDVDLGGNALPGGAAPPGAKLATGPDGTTGFDVTGNGRPDLGVDGKILPNGDLPPGSQVATGPDGTRGIDLNGDGIPDVDFRGHALPGGSAPPGSTLGTGPDGTTGFDVTGNGRPDLGLNGQPLSNGDLPPGSRVVTGPNGAQGIDLNGDGVPDVDFGGHALPGGSAPPGSSLATGPTGTTGFDLNGDGIPDVGLHGEQLPTGGGSAGLDPGGQVIQQPGGAGGDGRGGFPGNAVGGSASGGALAQAAGGVDPAIAAAAGRGYPPMMPPMMPPQSEKSERETWLQEEDDVWAGDEDLAMTAALGRPVVDEEEEMTDADWEEPPVPVRPAKGRPRPQRPSAGSWPSAGARRGG
jgi:hypothetical protein